MANSNYSIIGGYNKYPNLDFDQEETINLYAITDPEGKKPIALLNTPGLQEEVVVMPGNAPSRALFTFGDNMYGVFGSGVYLFEPSDGPLIPVQLGSLGTDSGYVSIDANNGNQLIFVDGQQGYIYTIGGTFGPITSTDFPPLPLNVCFFDTYFVIPSADSRSFQLSANNDGTQWNAFLDDAQAQTYPGDMVGVGVTKERLYFFKETSTEIWYNPGAADFPLRKDTNVIFNFGCLATASIVYGYGYLFWISRDQSGPASIMMSVEESLQVISNRAIESLMATFTNPSDVNCYIYKYDSHLFYVINWTTDDYTLVYDVTTQLWHRMEMESNLPVQGEPFSGKTRHIGSCHAYFNGKHYIGSYKAPILYSMSRDYPDNAGEPIKRQRTGKTFFDPNYRKLQINFFPVDIQPGVGRPNTIYDNPNIYLSVSKDGGHVFGSQQEAIMGKAGNRQTRAFWRKKGLARNWTPRLTIYASVAPILIMGNSLEYEVLPK